MRLETFRVIPFRDCVVTVSNHLGTVSAPIPTVCKESLPDYSPLKFCEPWRNAMHELFELSSDRRASVAHFCTVASVVSMTLLDRQRAITERMVVVAPDIALAKAIVAPFMAILSSRGHCNTYVKHRIAAMSLDDFDSPEYRMKLKFRTDDAKQIHPFMFYQTGVESEQLKNTLPEIAKNPESTSALFNDMLFRYGRFIARGYFIDPCEKESNDLRELLLSTRHQRARAVMNWIHDECQVVNDGSEVGEYLNVCHGSFLRYCRRAHKMPCEVKMFRSVLSSMGFLIRRMNPTFGKMPYVIGLLPRTEII